MDRWSQALELLDEVLERPGPKTIEAARARAASEGCADELENLLAALDADSVLDTPLDESLRGIRLPEAPEGSLTGRVIDRWRLGDEIGRGGMSVVYHAHRSGDDFEQHAALKILAMTFAGRAMVDGFLRERRILSDLQHPGIARLIDGGLTPEGSPYLVLEYVDGKPIDRWCREHDAGARTVVRLVEQLSRAVAYAQRRLVIHRDINTSNVLVNERGRPVLIDFGIAGLLGTGEDRTMHAFTPHFAAPEQVAGERCTTATDVFAIGRLLETLLPGGRAAADRDLRLIIATATHEDPERRYASARNLADDLEAWLDKRPIRARPPSWRYRAGRFVARHRLASGVAALLLLSIVGGLAATSWQARIAAAERDVARAESARAREVTEFLKDLFRASDPDRAQGEAVTARDLLDQGAHQARTAFEDAPALKAEMLILLGDLNREIGEIEAARPLLDEGLQLADATGDIGLRAGARAALALQRMETGAHEEALALAEAAGALLEANGQVPGPGHAALMQTVVFSLAELGRVPEAVERGEAALALARAAPALPEAALFDYVYSTANALLIAERADEAEALLREAASMAFEAAEDPSIQIELYSNLAGALSRKGDLDTAAAYYQRAVDTAERIYPPGHLERARKLSNLASALNSLGRYEESQRALREALSIYEQAYPDGAHPRVAAAHNNLGRALQQAGRLEEAETHLARAHEMAGEVFGTEDPRYVFATSNLANLQLGLGNLDRADALLGQSAALARRIFGPEHRIVGSVMSMTAALRLAQGRPGEALKLCDDAIALFEAVGFESPVYLITVRTRRAVALAALGRDDEATAEFAHALRMGEQAGVDAGMAWPELLVAHAEFLSERQDPGGPAAAERAVAAYREMLGPEHPETLRVMALARAR